MKPPKKTLRRAQVASAVKGRRALKLAAAVAPRTTTAKAKRSVKIANKALAQPLPKESKKVKRLARVATAKAIKSQRLVKRRNARAAKSEIPPILLAGDNVAAAGASGPGQRYALGPVTQPPHTGQSEECGELPKSYGTAQLWLAARDPQWLYAHWDLSSDEQRRYNAKSEAGRLTVRVYAKEVSGEPLVTQLVRPESRNWFIHVGRGGTKFVAQLGYFDRRNQWQNIAVSPAAVTPPEGLSNDTSADFATLPLELPFQQIFEMVKTVVSQNVPLLEALAQLRETGSLTLPPAGTFASLDKAKKSPKYPPAESAGPNLAPAWTPAQAKALAEFNAMEEVRRGWFSSLELSELARGQFDK